MGTHSLTPSVAERLLAGQREIIASLARLEEQFEQLLEAIGEEDDGAPDEVDLDGNPCGAPRDTGQDLG